MYTNLSGRGRMGRSAAPNFYFGTPSIYAKRMELRVDEIWYTGRHVTVLWLRGHV